jgi:hypothetical protein
MNLRLVVNIEGNNVDGGGVQAEYIGAFPSEESGTSQRTFFLNLPLV